MADIAVPVATAAAPSRFMTVAMPRLIVGLVLLVLWEGVVRGFAPAYVAKPSSVIAAFPRVLADPKFIEAVGATLWAICQGLAVAIVFGIVIGLMIGRIPAAERALRHYVNGFYAIPMIVVLPLFSLWFGYSPATRVATIIFSAIFSIITNVADGARAVPKEYMEVARAFGSSRLRMMGEIVLPSSMPYLLAGFRLAAGRALIGAVVAEFFLSIGGIGYFILYNSRSFKHSEAFVGVVLLALFGVGLEFLINWMTRKFLPWYRREAQAN